MELESLCEYILGKSLKCKLESVWDVFKSKEVLIKQHFRLLFYKLCEKLVLSENSSVLKQLHCLATMEYSVLVGATQMVQLMGWYSVYRETVS